MIVRVNDHGKLVIAYVRVYTVHLSPHPDKNRTFKLPAADRKTVTEAMKDKK